MLKLVLALSLSGGSAHGLASLAESTAETSTAAALAALVPASSAEVATTVLITGIAAGLYSWGKLTTRRVYQRAADEARASLSQHDSHPISSSGPTSELRRAADVECERLRLSGQDPAALGEVEVAKLVIAHAEAM